MPEPTNMDSNSRLYGILFTVIAVVALVALVYLLTTRSQADDVSQTTTVANAAPTIGSINVATSSLGADATSLTVVENTTTTFYVHGSSSDNNGCNDIDTASNWDMDVYRTNVASADACTSDNNDCYKNVSTTQLTFTGCTGAGDNTLTYEWTWSPQYYIDATDTGAPNAATNWTVGVKAGDEAAAASAVTTDTFEINSLIALNVTSSVAYGTLAVGADSAQQTITFTNTGNRDIDANQTASGDMICNGQGSNNITLGNAKISLTNGFTYGTGDASLTTTTTALNLTLARRTNDAAAATKDAYLILRMPSTNVRGTCTNTVTFAAIADV